jgi:hypothetical protein
MRLTIRPARADDAEAPAGLYVQNLATFGETFERLAAEDETRRRRAAG